MEAHTSVPSQADTNLVNNFWQEYVDGYIFQDLDRAVAAGDNYLVALGEMCYTEYFGKLMSGRPAPTANFSRFVARYLPQYGQVINRFYNEVRSGLVHSYFPDNVDVIGITWTDQGDAIRLVGGRWKIAVSDFLVELRRGAATLKVDLLAGRYLQNFNRLVSANPGLARIGPFGQGTGGGPSTPPTAGVASTVVTTTSGMVIRP